MIAIKEMGMPENCVDCPFYSGAAGGTCLVDVNSYNNQTMCHKEFERQDWCPLIEIESGD